MRVRTTACTFAALTLAALAWTVWPAFSQTDDLDVLKVIPENYKLIIEISSFACSKRASQRALRRSRIGT